MRRVFVTGSSRGIGKQIAELLLREGFDVVLHGRDANAPHASQSVRELSEITPQRRFLSFDIADRERAKAVLDSELSEHGAFYGVVLCAGVTRDMPFPGLSGSDWDYILRTNLDGFFNVLHPLTLPMIQLRSGGRIVVVSSLSGIIGNRGQVPYSAAKAGLIGAAKALARELAKRAITVNCIAPGPVETDMLEAEVARKLCEVIPLGRAATVKEVASAVQFLFRDDASYMTGQVLTLSGGLV